MDGNWKSSSKRVLLFNCTMGRDAKELLGPIFEIHSQNPFDVVIFSTNETGQKGASDRKIHIPLSSSLKC